MIKLELTDQEFAFIREALVSVNWPGKFVEFGAALIKKLADVKPEASAEGR